MDHLSGNEKKATAAVKKLAMDVQKNEPVTLLYIMHTNFKEKSLPMPPADEVVFIEIYKDQTAFIKYISRSIFTNFVKSYGNLFLQAFNTPQPVFITTEVLTQIEGFARAGLK
ncbi:MAG TPA: hypothetical protein VE978_19800 [Chitinophagales bacterium]|nr:hypothetical protein [Chitinophagales bacterium]